MGSAIAFKEWAIVVDALGRGDQSLILRKGGIREGKGGFGVDHSEFWLFPTRFHQQHESVIDSAKNRCDQIVEDYNDETSVRIEYFVRIVDWVRIENLNVARKLDPFHIWKPEVVEDRFEWGRDQGVFAMITRVYRLPQFIRLPVLKSYGGCKSWIELEANLSSDVCEPVLSDVSFEAQRKSLKAALKSSEVGA